MRRAPRLLTAAVLAAGGVAGPAVAAAAPAGFPDVDAYPAVEPGDYAVQGAHPSGSGWLFATPGGLTCRDSLIPDLGVYCTGAVPGVEPPADTVAVSLTKPGVFLAAEQSPSDMTARLLPTGSKIAAGNGVVCAVPTEEELVCRAQKPDSWAPDTPDPPDRHYGEHGFVVSPAGSWAY